MVAGRTGRDDIRFQSVPWASVYMNARLADRYRVGHVFLIGKYPVRTAGGRAQAASFTSLGFQFQGRSCSRFWML
jgi:hypothetical protein